MWMTLPKVPVLTLPYAHLTWHLQPITPWQPGCHSEPHPSTLYTNIIIYDKDPPPRALPGLHSTKLGIGSSLPEGQVKEAFPGEA
jgi:hypothetical protein